MSLRITLTAFYYDSEWRVFTKTWHVPVTDAFEAARRIVRRGKAHRVAFPLFVGGGGGWFWDRESSFGVES